jgi:hypothetical protein
MLGRIRPWSDVVGVRHDASAVGKPLAQTKKIWPSTLCKGAQATSLRSRRLPGLVDRVERHQAEKRNEQGSDQRQRKVHMLDVHG